MNMNYKKKEYVVSCRMDRQDYNILHNLANKMNMSNAEVIRRAIEVITFIVNDSILTNGRFEKSDLISRLARK